MQPGFRIAVTDQGPGIDDAEVETIFRPFYTTKSAGTGLGLSISRKIVSAHAGTLRVDCDGEGTVFTVLLPDHVQAAPRGREQEMS